MSRLERELLPGAAYNISINQQEENKCHYMRIAQINKFSIIELTLMFTVYIRGY